MSLTSQETPARQAGTALVRHRPCTAVTPSLHRHLPDGQGNAPRGPAVKCCMNLPCTSPCMEYDRASISSSAITRLGAGEDAVVLGGHVLHGPLAVHRAVGQHHGRVVLVHDLARDAAHQLAVHVLRPGQALRQPLELLRAPFPSSPKWYEYTLKPPSFRSRPGTPGPYNGPMRYESPIAQQQ